MFFPCCITMPVLHLSLVELLIGSGFVVCFRLREHNPSHNSGQDRNHGLRCPRHSSDVDLPVQHGQSAEQLRTTHLHAFSVLLPLLQLRLLLLRREAHAGEGAQDA